MKTIARCVRTTACITTALALAAPAQAKIILEAPLPDGSTVLFHDEAGPCEGDALMVEYVSSAGTRKVRGCWVDSGDQLACVFLDGDIGAVPKRLLRPPKGA